MTSEMGRGLVMVWLERQYVKYVFSLHMCSQHAVLPAT